MTNLKKGNPVLYWFGWINVGLLVLAIVMTQLDSTVITGINAWIKPAKFAVSITIYAWTFAWLLEFLPEANDRKRITKGIVVCMTVENVLIFMQAARGVRSHFNITTPFDSLVFTTMGIFIAINSLIVLYTIVLFFTRNIQLPVATLWSWRAGLIFFFLGGISGGLMSGMLGHTVGATDGGPGLPLLNWSTLAGDIRTAHFFTLHGLQIIPLAAIALSRLHMESKSIILVLSTLYLAFCLWLHWLAISGQPLLAAYP